MPATFTIAPSGARLPLRPTTPPVMRDRLVGRTDDVLLGRSSSTCSMFSAIVRPVTVRQSPCKIAVIEQGLHQAAECRRPRTCPWRRICRRASGRRCRACFSKISATSNRSNSMPASCAIAGRCSAALVEPPVAATTAAAFSSALRVTMSRGRMFLAISSITFSPEAKQKRSRIS